MILPPGDIVSIGDADDTVARMRTILRSMFPMLDPRAGPQIASTDEVFASWIRRDLHLTQAARTVAPGPSPSSGKITLVRWRW